MPSVIQMGLLRAPAFTAVGRTYTWGDVLRAATVSGEWSALATDTAMLMRHEATPGAPGVPDEHAVQQAARRFRHARNLLAADDLNAWLEQRDLTHADWIRSIRHELMTANGIEELWPGASSPELAAVDVGRAVAASAVCSGRLSAWREHLAERIAVYAEEVGPEQAAAAPPSFEKLDETWRHFEIRAVGDAALEAEARAHRLEWTRLTMRYLVHERVDVIREASMCVRVDRQPLAAVAQDGGLPLGQADRLLEQIAPALRAPLISAQAGELVGPLHAEERHWLLAVLRRQAPTTEDPAIRNLARRLLLERALAGRVSRHISFHGSL